MNIAFKRYMPVGAEIQGDLGVHFRVWAPKAHELTIYSKDALHALDGEENGYFSGFIAGLRAGDRYAFRIDDVEKLLPDPASRFQPEGPHGPSEIIQPSQYRWTDQEWTGVRLQSQVIYEMHVGTFTPEGTWHAASRKLPFLADVGITLVEMMPVAAFSGTRGWGYDGVGWFAPTHLYGRPDDLREFIVHAHSLGIGVILDVVYNHFGPDGNYLPCFSDAYTTEKYPNEWGRALNFDDKSCAPVREYVRENACYWIREFHFDGLRLDATQQIFDSSPEHIVAELTRCAREAAGVRDIVIIAENEPQDSNLVRSPNVGGFGLDAIWNDDFHHSIHVALTGHNEAYYSDYQGSSRELAALSKYGFLYQGQRSSWQRKSRGSPSRDIHARQRINFLENHDQVANSGRGQRLIELTDPGNFRTATALLILSPGTPMLFQGQEFGSEKPFLFFADLRKELTDPVVQGRRKFLSQFPSLTSIELAAPHDPVTFSESVLHWSKCECRVDIIDLHRDLIALKKTDPVVSIDGKHGLETATLSETVLLVRFYDPEGEDRLLMANLGIDLAPTIFPEPLLAPPLGRRWLLVWSSEDRKYGGGGVRSPQDKEGMWHFQGHAAALLKAAWTTEVESR
jgi:maltooligosyltrehalose trehalohydrolase